MTNNNVPIGPTIKLRGKRYCGFCRYHVGRQCRHSQVLSALHLSAWPILPLPPVTRTFLIFMLPVIRPRPMSGGS